MFAARRAGTPPDADAGKEPEHAPVERPGLGAAEDSDDEAQVLDECGHGSPFGWSDAHWMLDRRRSFTVRLQDPLPRGAAYVDRMATIG